MTNVTTIAAVASAPRRNGGVPNTPPYHYGATARRPASLTDDVYQSFSALPDDMPTQSPLPSPRCTLTLHPGTRQVAPSFLCLGGSSLCLAVASYELSSSLSLGHQPAFGPIASLVAVSVGLNVAALFAARRIGAPFAEPENIVD